VCVSATLLSFVVAVLYMILVFFLNLSIFVPIRWPSLLNYMQACSLNMSKWLSA
jgi:hypothetical protein